MQPHFLGLIEIGPVIWKPQIQTSCISRSQIIFINYNPSSFHLIWTEIKLESGLSKNKIKLNSPICEKNANIYISFKEEGWELY